MSISDETGMNNPIYGLMSQQNSSNVGNMNSGMQNMGMNTGMQNMGMNTGMQNMGMNTGMPNMGMNTGMNQGFGMNNMGMNPNFGMNMGMGNMGMNMGMGMMGQFNNQMQTLNKMNEILNAQGNNSQIQNNMGNSNPNQSFSNNQGITILFRKNDMNNNEQIAVQCTPDEKVADIIQKYRSKSGDKDLTKKFIFNAKALNPNLTVSEAGLNNQANIFVVTTQNVKGAY